jgi:cytoskeleton protein RodZ
MDSFGDRLRQAREKLNLSIDQVSRDTHIARRYVEGLEREDFAGFPGETYSMGFLRNYAAFLGIDADEMVAMYKNLRIQEQPVPMTELLEDRKRHLNPVLIAVVAAAVLVVAAIGYGIYRLASSRAGQAAVASGGPADAGAQARQQQAGGQGASYVLEEPAVVRWFSQGDRITVPFGEARISIVVSRIEKEVYVELPSGVDILAVGDKKRIDVDNDGKIDLQIQLNSVDVTTGERKANIGLYKLAKPADEPRAGSPAVEGEQPVGGEAETSAPGAVETTGDAVAAPIRQLQRPIVTLREAEAAGPFSITLAFSGRCLFRFQVDGADRETRLFLKGGTFQLEAERTLRLWVSNAGVVDARVAGKDLDLGRQGEVASVDIRWERDATSRKQRLRSYPVF